jgi:hypothetical protein
MQACFALLTKSNWHLPHLRNERFTHSTLVTSANFTLSLAHRRDHSGILIIPRQRYSVGEKIRRLMQLIDATSAEEMRNWLEFL